MGCYDQFPEHVRQLYTVYRINYGYFVRVRVGLGLGFRSGQSQYVTPFSSVNYHFLVKSRTRRSRSVPPFRSVPEIITTPRLVYSLVTDSHTVCADNVNETKLLRPRPIYSRV